jgi:hypothetical protein
LRYVLGIFPFRLFRLNEVKGALFKRFFPYLVQYFLGAGSCTFSAFGVAFLPWVYSRSDLNVDLFRHQPRQVESDTGRGSASGGVSAKAKVRAFSVHAVSVYPCPRVSGDAKVQIRFAAHGMKSLFSYRFHFLVGKLRSYFWHRISPFDDQLKCRLRRRVRGLRRPRAPAAAPFDKTPNGTAVAIRHDENHNT